MPFTYLLLLGCTSLKKSRCLFPFTVNDETYYRCSRGINNSDKFQCATRIEVDGYYNRATEMEECDMESCPFD